MASDAPLIEVERLRVGMYIQLDLSWTEHPFSFSSFKIRSADQIDTLRSLGLRQVRYLPARSDVGPAPAVTASPSTRIAAAAPAAPSLAERAQQARRERLESQQRSLQRAERAFDDAGRQLKQMLNATKHSPAEAAQASAALAQSLLSDMGSEREVSIRLLSERAGDETALHALNVCVLSLLLGRAVGLGAMSLRELAQGALLHDIGKLNLPTRLRFASDQLTVAERRAVQRHVEDGVAIGEAMGLSPTVLAIIAEHHEFADGSGYPNHLRGVQLSPAARVVSLVNYYDNLCNPGNVLHALTPHEALATMFAKHKALFDAPTLALFVRMMGIYPPGSVLQLNDGRYALSVAVDPLQPRKPLVVIYDAKVPSEQALVVELSAEPGLEVDQALKPSALPRAVFEYLSPRQRQSFYFDPM